MTDREGFLPDELIAHPDSLESQQLRALFALAEKPDVKIVAAIDPLHATGVSRGISSTVTITGQDSNGAVVGEPIETTTNVVLMVRVEDVTHQSLRVALNVALRTALLNQPRTAPTSPKPSGK